MRFTLGSTAQDQLSILAGGSFLSSQSISFTIDRLGVIQIRVIYTVLNLPNGANGYLASEF